MLKGMCGVAIIVALCGQAYADAESPRSESSAVALSLVGTVAPTLALTTTLAHADELSPTTVTFLAVSAAGLYALPSAGHWYSGKGWTLGWGVRTGGMVFVGLGFVSYVQSIGCHCYCGENGREAIIMGIGGVFVLGGAIHDIATAGARARAFNARLTPRPVILPTPMPGGGAGVSLSMRF